MRELLKKLGFSEKEADVYLGVFKLGSGSISALAKQAKIKRPTVYVILEKLKKMGLVRLEKKDKKQIFIAENPERLLVLLEQKKKLLMGKEERLKKALPEIKAMMKKETAIPAVRYYEGKENVWNIIEDQITAGSENWTIAPGKIFDIFGANRMMKEIIEKRNQMGKKIYLITDRHKEMVNLWKLNEMNIREFRFVPDNIELDATIYIYAGKVALIFWKEPFSGLIIENEKLFKVMKFLYNALWKELEGENLPPHHNEL